MAQATRPIGNQHVPSWWHAWAGLYEGRLLADDLEQLARDLSQSGNVRANAAGEGRDAALPSLDDLLGNHEDDAPLSEALQQALNAPARK